MSTVKACLMALCTTPCLLGANAFTLPAQVMRTLPSEPTMRREPSAVGASAFAGAQRTSSAPTAALAFGALLVGAAAMRRKSAKAVPTARRVTMQEIENLSLDDVPSWWRPKISLGMARRDFVKQAIARELDDCYFIMAFNKTGMPTPQFEEARSMFPSSVMVRCLKNSLVRKAMEGTPWEDFGNAIRGSNAFVFVKNDKDLKPTIKAYLAFAKKFKRDQVIEEMLKGVGKGAEFSSTIGGVLRDEWDVIPPADIAKLKDFPTKTELIGQIAFCIKQVPTRLARGTKQVPQKLAIGLKKVQEKMEDNGKDSVGDVVA